MLIKIKPRREDEPDASSVLDRLENLLREASVKIVQRTPGRLIVEAESSTQLENVLGAGLPSEGAIAEPVEYLSSEPILTAISRR